LTDPDVLIGEGCGREGGGEDVAGGPVVGEVDGGGRVAVVDLVHSHGRNRQRAGNDVGERRRGRGRRVVGGVGAGDGDAIDGNRLAGHDVIVIERGVGERHVNHIAEKTIVGDGHDRGRVSVVDLVLAGRPDRQRSRSDVGGGG